MPDPNLETRTRIDQVRASIRELSMRAATQRLTVARLSGQAEVLSLIHI